MDSSVADSCNPCCNLHLLAHLGHENRLRQLLHDPVNSLNDQGETPLLCADFTKPEILSLLLEHGANVVVVNAKGLSALHLAVRAKCIESVRIVLDAGVDVNSLDSDGATALCYTVDRTEIEKNVPIAKLLLDRGAHITCPYTDSGSILFEAVSLGNEAMADLLLDYVSDLTTENKNGSTVLEWAILASDEPSIARRLIERSLSLNQLSAAKIINALRIAVTKGHLNQAKLLAEKSVQLNIHDDEGLTAVHSILFVAVSRGNEAMVELLLDYVPDLTIKKAFKNKLCFTVLECAIIASDEPSIARRLIERGADVNHLSLKSKLIILRFAVTQPRFNQIKLLVEKGTELNIIDNRGHTLVHTAVLEKTEDVGQLLSLLEILADKCGMNLAARTKEGLTALHFAAKWSDGEVLGFLMDRAGLRVDDRDDDCFQPMHCAAMSGNSEGCAFLLRHGADVNAKCKFGYSSLMYAALEKKASVAEMLLEHGAEVTQDILKRDDVIVGEVKRILLKHLAKLECLGLAMDEKVLKTVKRRKKVKTLFKAYVAEMKKMREIKIFDDVSLLDIATRSKAILSGYAKNEQLVSGFEKKYSKSKFPRLYKIVSVRFKKEVEKQQALMNATSRLDQILPLNIEVNRKIVSYMKEDNL